MRICGVFKDYDALCDELVEIHKNVSVKNLSIQEEGVVITLIQRNEQKADDAVISMSKIKSIEYMALKMTSDLLKKSIDNNELERYSENITQ